MKKTILSFFFIILLVAISVTASAQCSVCTRTTEQMGETPAGKINAGILYLAAAPLAIVGFVGWRWWRKNGS